MGTILHSQNDLKIITEDIQVDKEIGNRFVFERPTTALVEDQDDEEHMEESDELGSGARGG